MQKILTNLLSLSSRGTNNNSLTLQEYQKESFTSLCTMYHNVIDNSCHRCFSEIGVVHFPSKQVPSVPHFSLGKMKEEEKGSAVSHYLDLGIMNVYQDFVTQIM